MSHVSRKVTTLLILIVTISVTSVACGNIAPPAPRFNPDEAECLMTVVSWSSSKTIESAAVLLIKSKNDVNPDEKTNPSESELLVVDQLLKQNKYDEAHDELLKLQKIYPSSPEIYYKDIKSLSLELAWSQILPAGKQRCEATTKAIFQDYQGLTCESTQAYMEVYGSLDQHFSELKSLHDISVKATNESSCKHQPVTKYDLEIFKARLVDSANFMQQIVALFASQVVTTRENTPVPVPMQTASSSTQSPPNQPAFINEDFTSISNIWQTGNFSSEHADYRYEIVDGVYKMHSTFKAKNMSVWTKLPISAAKDFKLTFDAMLLDATSDSGLSIAIAFRYKDDENFYFVRYMQGGFFTVDVRVDGHWSNIKGQTSNKAIRLEKDVTSKLGIVVKDSNISLYVNDHLFYTIEDTTLDEAGGILIGIDTTMANQSVTIQLDNVSVSE